MKYSFEFVSFSILADFWRKSPALLYGLSLLLGTVFALYSFSFSWLCCFSVLFLLPILSSASQRNAIIARCSLALVICVSAYLLTTVRYQFPVDSLVKGGVAEVEVDGVVSKRTPFGSVWQYSGTLIGYSLDNQIVAKGIPVMILLSHDRFPDRPVAGIRYLIDATLKTTSQGTYVVKPTTTKPWIPLKHLSVIGEWRYRAKSALRHHLEEEMHDDHISAFLTGIMMGEFDDRLLSVELSRFGLQHLMAISGFHFSILAAIFAFSLAFFFPRPIVAGGLITLITAYFLFLGDSPSVTRSWIAIVMGLAALFFERRSSALNALGVGLIVVMLWDPLAIESIGFQFSFGVTASILLLHAPFERLLQHLFPRRLLSEAIRMDVWDQHAYCLLYWLRQALALAIAVNIVALPLTLYHFHKFPWIGLYYNLFFPPLVSLSMLLLLLALAAYPILPALGSYFHALNEWYTGALLNMATHFPKAVDTATLRVESVPTEALCLYLLVLFLFSVTVRDVQTID